MTQGSIAARDTRMYEEARSASAIVEMQLRENGPLMQRIGELLRDRKPQVVVTCADRKSVV